MEYFRTPTFASVFNILYQYLSLGQIVLNQYIICILVSIQF